MVLSNFKNALAMVTDKRAAIDDDSAPAENIDHARAISSWLDRLMTFSNDVLRFAIKKLQINPISLDADAGQFRWIAWSLLITASPPQYLS